MTPPTPLADAYAVRVRGWIPLLGWRYPAEFAGAAREHRAVRSAVGLFDAGVSGRPCP